MKKSVYTLGYEADGELSEDHSEVFNQPFTSSGFAEETLEETPPQIEDEIEGDGFEAAIEEFDELQSPQPSLLRSCLRFSLLSLISLGLTVAIGLALSPSSGSNTGLPSQPASLQPKR
jgi:hypothetical protein